MLLIQSRVIGYSILVVGLVIGANTHLPAQDAPASESVVEGYPLDIIAKLQIRDRRLAQLMPRSVIDNVRLWPQNREITVAFRGGTDQARKEIEQLAGILASHGNFSFRFRNNVGGFLEWSPTDTSFAADIRVGFDLSGYWSLLGTDSRNAAIRLPGQRSMNLNGMADGSLTNNEGGTVIHEFGHAMGFHHEHQNPNGGCDTEFRWENDPGYIRTTDSFGQFIKDHRGRRPGIYTVLGGPPNNWTNPQIDFNLRQLPNSSAFTVSGHDPDSIMHYSFPLWMFVNGATSPCFTNRNNNLSAQDIIGIKAAYPPGRTGGNRLGTMPMTAEIRSLVWMPDNSGTPGTSGLPNKTEVRCCGQAALDENDSGDPTSLKYLEQRASKRSESARGPIDSTANKNVVQASVRYANELAGNDDRMFTRTQISSRVQAMMQGRSTNQAEMSQLTAMMFPPKRESGLIWDMPALNKNFRSMMNRAAKKDSGLVPVTGPPLVGRVVGPGTQLVDGTKYRDCVAVGARINGEDRFCCTGTLVAPTVVVTAGHCFFCNGGGANNAVVFVGENVAGTGKTFVGRAFRHPDYDGANRNDLAVIVLDQPVTGVAPRRIGSTEQINNMTFGRVVGFGNSDFASSGGFGTKRMVDVPVASVDCAGQGQAASLGCDPQLELVAGFVGLGADSCNGDSGGPIYALVGTDARNDDAWVVVGATSRATSRATRPCGDGGIYERLDKFKNFIETVSQVDLDGDSNGGN